MWRERLKLREKLLTSRLKRQAKISSTGVQEFAGGVVAHLSHPYIFELGMIGTKNYMSITDSHQKSE